MQELRDELAEQYELNDLKLALSNSRGYHFTYSTKGLDSSRIPRVFHSRTNSKDLHRYVMQFLVLLSHRNGTLTEAASAHSLFTTRLGA